MCLSIKQNPEVIKDVYKVYLLEAVLPQYTSAMQQVAVKSIYRKTQLTLTKNGDVQSNRKNIALTPTERRLGQVEKGLHVFTRGEDAILEAISVENNGNGNRLPVVVRFKASSNDLVASGTWSNNTPNEVYMKLKADELLCGYTKDRKLVKAPYLRL